MASGSDKKNKKIFDVAKPGNSPPSSSARPIIIGHKPLQQDPMVTASMRATKLLEPPGAPQVSDEEKPSGINRFPSATANKIMPPSSVKIEPISEDQNAEETKAPVEKTLEPEDNGQTVSSDSAAIEAIAVQAEAKRKSERASEATKVKNETLEKVIAEKKYFVPIGEKRRRRRSIGLLVTLLALAVLLVGAYLLADAKVIKTNVTLPYDFIKK